MQSASLYETVTASIVATLEQGNLPPWRRPWAAGEATIPLRHNGEPYKGANVILLWIAATARGYSSPYYMTFRQAKLDGGSVRKGEKGIPIIYCEPITKRETTEDGSEADSRFWLTKTYIVFSAEQCDGLPDKYTAKPVQTLDTAQRIDQADAFVANTAATIRHGSGGAFYRPSEDFINLPPFETFESPETYYGTALHELAHWTGAPQRLTRDLKPQTNREAYAREEILAELASCFLAAQLGIEPVTREDHASYLAFWVQAMKADHRYIFTAAAAAQKAADYLTGLQPKPEG